MTTAERAWALSWVDDAVRYQEENAELRGILTALLLAIVRNRDLLSYARSELERAA